MGDTHDHRNVLYSSPVLGTCELLIHGVHINTIGLYTTGYSHYEVH